MNHTDKSIWIIFFAENNWFIPSHDANHQKENSRSGADTIRLNWEREKTWLDDNRTYVSITPNTNETHDRDIRRFSIRRPMKMYVYCSTRVFDTRVALSHTIKWIKVEKMVFTTTTEAVYIALVIVVRRSFLQTTEIFSRRAIIDSVRGHANEAGTVKSLIEIKEIHIVHSTSFV